MESPGGSREVGAARRAELAAFLHASRASVDPVSVGFATGRRRVSGLRREEVASRANISLSWYLKLERGYDVSVSLDVVDAIARALQLDAEGHRHLRRLSGHLAPRLDTSGSSADPRLVQLIDDWTPAPAYIINRSFDVVALNRSFVAVYGEPLALGDIQNTLWTQFTCSSLRARMLDWEQGSAAVVAGFRAETGRHPDSTRARELIAALTDASAEFRTLWSGHRVERFKGHSHRVRLDSGEVVELDTIQFRPVEQSDLIVVLTRPLGPDDGAHLLDNLQRA